MHQRDGHERDVLDFGLKVKEKKDVGEWKIKWGITKWESESGVFIYGLNFVMGIRGDRGCCFLLTNQYEF